MSEDRTKCVCFLFNRKILEDTIPARIAQRLQPASIFAQVDENPCLAFYITRINKDPNHSIDHTLGNPATFGREDGLNTYKIIAPSFRPKM